MNRHRRSHRVSMGGWNRLLVVALGILLVSWSGPAASAFWSSVSSNGAAAKSDALAQGSKPSTSVTGTNVSVTWAASTTAAGRSVTGYSIARYGAASGGNRVPATGACAGTVTSLACVEANVPAGTWYYTVTPMLALWQGQESARSAGTTPVTDTTPPAAPTVTAPALVNSLNVGNVPVGGTAEANSTVTLTVSGAGASSFSQTIIANSAGGWTAAPVDVSRFTDGTITFSAKATDAAGNTGGAGTATSKKKSTPPTVANVELANVAGGVAGKIEKGDTVTITFSDVINGKTVCNTWPVTGSFTVNGNNQVTVNVSPNNVLSVSLTGCALNLGSVNLGAGYTSTALSFSGSGNGNGTTPNFSSMTWSGNRVVITLGSGVSGGNTVQSDPAVFASFTPAGNITDTDGNPLSTAAVTGTASRF